MERPLRLRSFPDRAIPNSVFKKTDEFEMVRKAITSIPENTPLVDWSAFAKATKLKTSVLKRLGLI